MQNLAGYLQMAMDSARPILMPMDSVSAIAIVPGELFGKFQAGFYSDPVDAALKAMGL